MFDYKLLAALGAVVEQGGFERAAQLLGLSQSAVSQRIKLLETRVGQPVLVRSTPQRPPNWGVACSIMSSRCVCWRVNSASYCPRLMSMACRIACALP